MGGKVVTYSQEQLSFDPFGYYSQERLVSGEPTGVGFYEEYPDQANAWVYEHLELDDEFDYEKDELNYDKNKPRSELKKHLDELHK